MTTQEMRKAEIPKGYIMWNYASLGSKPDWRLRKIDDSLRSFQAKKAGK